MAKKKSSRRKKAAGPRRARQGSDRWTKAHTSVSDLPPAKRQRMLGYRADAQELQELGRLIQAAEHFQAVFSTPRFAAPASVDWRNRNGNWISPVKNQLDCGSCVSFATVATVESRIKIECDDPGRDVDFSEAHLFFCGCGACCDPGWNFAPALDFAQDTGLALDSAWPYQDQNQPCRQDVQPVFKITSWKRALTTAERKESLAKHGPMVAGMKVFNDFFDYGGGVYSPGTNASGGYHAVSVVGYDDAQGCWICKNSWGTGWGEAGFFRIAYGTCEMDTHFPFYEVSVPCPQPAPVDEDCERYVPYLVRVLRYARLNPSFRACLRYHVCHTGYRPFCNWTYLRVARSVEEVLELCPRYRGPFCGAL